MSDVSFGESSGSQNAGISSHGVLVDERKQGWMTYRFELSTAVHDAASHLVFSLTCWKGAGRAGRKQDIFYWPSVDPLKEARTLLQQIVDACAEGAVVTDPRGSFARWFDKITGIKLINELAPLAELDGAKRHWIDARITEDSHGRLVTLCENMQGRGPLMLHIPLASIEALLADLSGPL